MEAWGRTASVLIGKLSETLSVPDDLMPLAKMLDKHYIPARYANGFDSGAPTDFYTQRSPSWYEAITHGRQL